MTRDHEAMRESEHARAVLRAGRIDGLEALEREIEGFPHGADAHMNERWILHALDVGPLDTVRWMVDRGVDLGFCDEAGYTPLLSALERTDDERLAVLELLLRAGAPVDAKGIHDWTPAHMAAARDDVDALRVLVAHGADLSIRTVIDDCATPLEEARSLGKQAAARYLESVGGGAHSP